MRRRSGTPCSSLPAETGVCVVNTIDRRVSVQAGTTTVGTDRHYDFGPVIVFWIGASVASLVLAATLWRVKVRD